MLLRSANETASPDTDCRTAEVASPPPKVFHLAPCCKEAKAAAKAEKAEQKAEEVRDSRRCPRPKLQSRIESGSEEHFEIAGDAKK